MDLSGGVVPLYGGFVEDNQLDRYLIRAEGLFWLEMDGQEMDGTWICPAGSCRCTEGLWMTIS